MARVLVAITRMHSTTLAALWCPSTTRFPFQCSLGEPFQILCSQAPPSNRAPVVPCASLPTCRPLSSSPPPATSNPCSQLYSLVVPQAVVPSIWPRSLIFRPPALLLSSFFTIGSGLLERTLFSVHSFNRVFFCLTTTHALESHNAID